MFGYMKKYQELIGQHVQLISVFNRLTHQHNKLIDEHNEVVRKINEKGGERFLNKGQIVEDGPQQFTKAEINTLINLCHPDKHSNKPSSVEITKKLLKLRNK